MSTADGHSANDHAGHGNAGNADDAEPARAEPADAPDAPEGPDRDLALMRLALAEGDRGRIGAAPNPWVGCVVVRDGVVVGAGHHRRAGEPHAEVNALASVGPAEARGATLYVSLEPCSHHGRTPPCVDALVAAGIGRVVVAVLDPDPRVSGRGVAALREAGVTVDVGVGEALAEAALAPYLHHRRTGRPYVVAKAAMSLDGRTAAADGTSRWITGEAARADAHRLRAQSQAIVVGAGTALADRPSLTVRHGSVASDPPLRVVLDARRRVPTSGPTAGPMFDGSAPTLVVAPPLVPPGPDGHGVDLAATLDLLGDRGILQVLVEGGARLHAAFLAAGLVDRFVLYVAPVVLGTGGRPLFDHPGPATMAAAQRWRTLTASQLVDDLRIECDPRP